MELGASHMEGYVLTNCAYILPYHVLHLFHCDTQNKFLINWLNLIQIHDQMNIFKNIYIFFHFSKGANCISRPSTWAWPSTAQETI